MQLCHRKVPCLEEGSNCAATVLRLMESSPERQLDCGVETVGLFHSLGRRLAKLTEDRMCYSMTCKTKEKSTGQQKKILGNYAIEENDQGNG